MRVLTRRIFPLFLAQGFILGIVYLAIDQMEWPLLISLTIGAVSETLLIWLILWYRRTKIVKLNKYLSEINQGKAKLDITVFTDSELGVLRSEFFRLSEALYQQNEQLKKDKKFILDALNDVAHQLKTPLTSVVMMVDLLQQDDLPKDKEEQFIENIENQLSRIQGLITNLLTLSKLEANVINYQPQAIMDSQLLRKLLAPFEVEIDVRDIHLDLQMDSQIIAVDIDWTIEALSNIVKNALEHMEDGGTLRILSTVNLMYWQVIIEDDGAGIKEEELPHIFERFYRGRKSNKNSIGIGLSLTKRIINQQKGLIKVESEFGKFTRFIIRFLK